MPASAVKVDRTAKTHEAAKEACGEQLGICVREYSSTWLAGRAKAAQV